MNEGMSLERKVEARSCRDLDPFEIDGTSLSRLSVECGDQF